MSDIPFVGPGNRPSQSAGLHNRMIDAARANARQSFGRAPEYQPRLDPQDSLLIVNNSGFSLRQFAIVGLTVPVFLPNLNPSAEHVFRQQTAFEIEWPATSASSGRFAILQDPLPVDAVGHAIIAGATVCYVEDSVVIGDSVDVGTIDDVLGADSGGSAKVLWCGPGTDLPEGARWGYIRFGGGGSGASIVNFAITAFDCLDVDDHGHLYATATVTAVACGISSPEFGDEILVFDLNGCHLTGAAPLLIGRKGKAVKMKHERADPPYGDGCDWDITELCDGGINC